MDPVVGAVVATVTRPLDAPDGRTLQLEYPRSMPEAVVQGTVIPAVEGVVRSLASIPAAVRRAVVTAYQEDSVRITYMSTQARVLRQDVIPVVATVLVHQKARNHLDDMGLDDDLWAAARTALDDKRRRRIGH